jgi:ABC-type transport system involved in multi-copper enzyme maturation permease subunit
MLSAKSFRNIFALARIRMRLLLRQKLGWISLSVGVGLVFLSFLVSNVSFINPQKIFWDFALATSFVLQLSLAVFLGSQLFHEERGRRTLHLILSSGVSRLQWLVGNALGIWAALTLMHVLCFVVTLFSSKLKFEGGLELMAAQSSFLLNIEVLLVLLMSIVLSLFLRQMLALAFSAILVVLLHSMNSIQSIFTDPQVGRYVEDNGASVVLWLARFLPPLEWLDLKSFVGYEPSVSWALVGQMTGLGLLWAVFLVCVSWLRFEKLDL